MVEMSVAGRRQDGSDKLSLLGLSVWAENERGQSVSAKVVVLSGREVVIVGVDMFYSCRIIVESRGSVEDIIRGYDKL